MTEAAKIGRAWMLQRIPAQHRSLISQRLPQGRHAALCALRSAGYNLGSAGQLILAPQAEPHALNTACQKRRRAGRGRLARCRLWARWARVAAKGPPQL